MDDAHRWIATEACAAPSMRICIGSEGWAWEFFAANIFVPCQTASPSSPAWEWEVFHSCNENHARRHADAADDRQRIGVDADADADADADLDDGRSHWLVAAEACIGCTHACGPRAEPLR